MQKTAATQLDSYETQLGEARRKCLQTSMVKKLLKIMADAVQVSGVAGSKRKQEVAYGVVSSSSPAKARFALGADDGAYLRCNVMPLETVLSDDVERLSQKLTVDMEIAGACGLLDAYSSSYSKKLEAKSKSLTAVWQTACWMISIAEVGWFVRQAIQKETLSCETAGRLALCDLMQSGGQMPLDNLNHFKYILKLLLQPTADVYQKSIENEFDNPKTEYDKIKNAMKDPYKYIQRSAAPPFKPYKYADSMTIGDDPKKAAFYQMFNLDNDAADTIHAVLDLKKLQTADDASDFSNYTIDNTKPRSKVLGFVLARGLCGRRAAHHRPSQNPDDDDGLFYNTPLVACPTMTQIYDIMCVGDGGKYSLPEFIQLNPGEDDIFSFDKQYKSMPTKWTPVKPDRVLDDSNEAILLAECSIIEHIARYCKSNDNLLYAAAAKVFQVPYLAKLYSINGTRLRNLCPSDGFQTVQLGPASGTCKVQYAFNSGVVKLAVKKSSAGPSSQSGSKLANADLKDMTKAFQRAQNCMYLSEPLPSLKSDKESANVGPLGSIVSFPKNAAHIQALEADKLYQLLKRGIPLCDEVDSIQDELAATESAKKSIEERSAEGMDQLDKARKDRARSRREDVWNDAMREAAISGDRLYAFVRQLSGTIHEQVDSVCVVDDSMLVQQQRDRQANAKRLSLLASQQHMQLVSNVFKSVISESGLTLGIDDKIGINGDLKVVSNTLRKQVSNLASGNGTEGFFTNSVRLENLMAQGTGEMTLSALFERIRDVGVALQQAAVQESEESSANDAPSLDYLSSPRNSLLLRYKPEAHAAIRQAYDTFTREMQTRHRVRGMYGSPKPNCIPPRMRVHPLSVLLDSRLSRFVGKRASYASRLLPTPKDIGLRAH